MTKRHPGEWFKSSRSGPNDPQCVEVRFAPHGVDVRDSKTPQAAVLSFNTAHWAEFLRTLVL